MHWIVVIHLGAAVICALGLLCILSLVLCPPQALVHLLSLHTDSP